METTIEHEAQTSLDLLLERVAQGERITITRHGVPVSVIESASISGSYPFREAVKTMESFEKYNLTLGEITLREAIDVGRA